MATPPCIERSSFDGHQGRLTVVASGLDHPSSLAVDWDSDLLFWADLGTKKVEVADLNGQNRKTLVNEKELQVISLSVSGSHLYWLDKEQQQIERINKTSGGHRTIVLSHLSHVSDLAVTNQITANQFHAHACFIKNGGCSHLCLPASNYRNCSCPVGLALSADNKTCVNPPTCSPDQFTCQSGKVSCIPKVWRCDNTPECEDGSDETGCPACKPSEFRCKNGECINKQDMCDGRILCKDSSEVCCAADDFFCPGIRKCLPILILCGTNDDCIESYDIKIASCLNKATFGQRQIDSETHDITSNYAIGGTIAVLVLVLMIGIAYIFMRKRNAEESEDVVDMMASKPLNSVQDYLMKDSGRNKNTIIMSHRNGSCSMSLPRSSVYDRNHITGASSSSSGGTLYPQTINPPPSPATMSQYTYSQCSSNAFSMPRSSYRLQRLPHPTPCSTDVCDDSEPYPCRSRYYMSNGELSYDSDAYPPPPPTPNINYLSEEGSYPPSPPPPSPVLLSDC